MVSGYEVESPTEPDNNQGINVSSGIRAESSVNESRVTQQVISNSTEIENKGKHNEQRMCPVCLLQIVDNDLEFNIFECGHRVHTKCINEFTSCCEENCPVCFKTVIRNEDDTI